MQTIRVFFLIVKALIRTAAENKFFLFFIVFFFFFFFFFNICQRQYNLALHMKCQVLFSLKKIKKKKKKKKSSATILLIALRVKVQFIK